MEHINKINMVVIVIFAVVFLIPNCNGQQRDIKTTLESFQDFSEFRRIIQKAQMSGTFSSSRKRLTLFAFNNSAYDKLSFNRKQKINSMTLDQSIEFIKAHTVYSKDVRTSDMNGVNQKEMSYNNLPLFISKRTQTEFTVEGVYGATLYYVNGAQINNNYKDIQCNNGYLHSLEEVMNVPSSESAFNYIKNPEDSRVKSRKFYELLKYLQVDYEDPVIYMGGLSNTLTLFVPSDDAFSNDRLPSSELTKLRGDQSRLRDIAYAHFIPKAAVFTRSVDHNKGFEDDNPNTQQQRNRIILRRPNTDQVYVNSLKVNALITYGNVTVMNGVIHVIDRILGLTFNSVRKEIEKYANEFNQKIIFRAEPTLANNLGSDGATQVTVFVPTNDAFQKIATLPWINLNTLNQTLANMIMRLHMLYQGRNVEISGLTGTYESRLYVETQDFGAKLSVYNERNESWVQGGPNGEGGVRAKILTPDVACTNGYVNYIDSVLGVPYLDLPMLICDDIWLVKTYDYLKQLGMTDYIRDRRFDAKKCYFEAYGRYPPNWSSGNQFQYTTPFQQPWNIGYSTTTPRPAQNQVAYSMGFCGQNRVGCKFTFFVPNSTAIDKFQAREEGKYIMRDSPVFQYLFRRLLFREIIILSDLAEGNSKNYQAHSGEYVTVRKTGTRNYELLYKEKRATVIHADLAATNGVVHIISDILYNNEDVGRKVSAGSFVSLNLFLMLHTFIISTLFLLRR